MSVYSWMRLSVALACLCLTWLPLRAEPAAGLQTERLLSEASEPVRIVCFGASGNTSAQGLARMQTDVLARTPHLVFVSLAPHLLAYRDEENFIRQAAWVVNWALPFSGTAWTAVGVDVALLSQGLTRKQREGAELLREIVRGHDLDWIGSPPGASVKLQDALDRWFDAQLEKNSACDRQSGASQTGEGE